MKYAFKMMAVVLALGVILLQGCQTYVEDHSKYLSFDKYNPSLNKTNKTNKPIYNFANWSNNQICQLVFDKNTKTFDMRENYLPYVSEAKSRGLDCNLDNNTTETVFNKKDNKKVKLSKKSNQSENVFTKIESFSWNGLTVTEKKLSDTTVRVIITDVVNNSQAFKARLEEGNAIIKVGQTEINSLEDFQNSIGNIIEEKRKGALFLVKVPNGQRFVAVYTKNSILPDVKYASKPKVKTFTKSETSISSAELDTERQKRIELERKLAAIKAKQKQEQQKIETDTRVPLLKIISNETKGKRGTITGIARDNVEVAEVTIDGQEVQLSGNGSFKYSTFVPSDGITLNIQVTDLAGLTSSKTVSLKRNGSTVSTSISFDRLNPLNKKVKGNANALALIVGVEGYENTNADALYADRDAKMFKDYASEKLGIPENRIKILLNDKAEYGEILLATKDWLRRASKIKKSDIFIFFAGHGLASDDGKNMYLLPYDGRPRLLNKTALLRDELFKDIQQSNPRSVTVFLDTCYSGTTRGTDMLVASRPIFIAAKEQSIPNNFTVFSAAAGDQTSKPLEEAKHGMFSYFLMKGMEGDADANNDNKITARELHAYVEQNVVQQSSGSQTPELQGDKDRVLVQFN